MEIKPVKKIGNNTVYYDNEQSIGFVPLEPKALEMTAKEMFEELGYEYKKTDFEIYYTMEFRDCCDEWYEMGIRFRLSDKTIFCDFEIDMPTLKAINKQVEELGWFR